MKKLLFIAMIVVGVSALVLAGRGGGVGGQDSANGPGLRPPEPGGFGPYDFVRAPECEYPGPAGGERFGPLGGLPHPGEPPMMLGMLDLTEEQKDVIAQLVKDSRKKLQADIEAVLTDEQLEKLQQLRDDQANRPFEGLDLTEEQKAAIDEIREKAKADAETTETREAKHQIMQAAHEEILSVLTEEQIDKLKQLHSRKPWERRGPGEGHQGKGPGGPFDGHGDPLSVLDLTEEQQAAIAEIREKARADAEAAETREARHEIMQAAHEEVLSVLTDQQIAKLEQLREDRPWGRGGPGKGHIGPGPGGPFEGPEGPPPLFEILDLTEEQKAAIAEIRENAKADAEAAETREARHEIMQAAHEEVLSVLTDQQIEKLEQLREERPRGRGRHRPGR